MISIRCLVTAAQENNKAKLQFVLKSWGDIKMLIGSFKKNGAIGCLWLR